MRLLIVGITLHLLIGCTETDDRPQTLAYITETILAPNCATAECHSNLKQQSTVILDTVEHAHATLNNPNHNDVVPGDPDNSYLLEVITTQDQFGNRMPLDHPLANKDIYLIKQWIVNGADGITLVPPLP
jgi:hypothetical protein